MASYPSRSVDRSPVAESHVRDQELHKTRKTHRRLKEVRSSEIFVKEFSRGRNCLRKSFWNFGRLVVLYRDLGSLGCFSGYTHTHDTQNLICWFLRHRFSQFLRRTYGLKQHNFFPRLLAMLARSCVYVVDKTLLAQVSLAAAPGLLVPLQLTTCAAAWKARREA